MRLTYFGHSAFTLQTAADVRLMIDPYRNPQGRRWFSRDCPVAEVELLVITHDHFDHDAISAALGQPSILRHPVELRYRDLILTGYQDWHVSGHSSAHLTNTIFVIESGGVRVCHLGDNRFPPPAKISDAIGDVDVLIVPVDDSCHLLEYDDVDAFIDLFRPRVVIPVHYLIADLTDPDSTLLPIDGWLERHERVRHLAAGPVWLAADELPHEREIWVFSPELTATGPDA